MSPLNSALAAVIELLDLVPEDRAESAPVTVISKESKVGRMHILLDILLTDSWKLAMIKVALATTEKRPDIDINTGSVNHLKIHEWGAKRKQCHHCARRLREDEDGLDPAWLMLAANPNNSITYRFIRRVSGHVVLMRKQTDGIESVLHQKMIQRFER